jgi:hypothetical protein
MGTGVTGCTGGRFLMRWPNILLFGFEADMKSNGLMKKAGHRRFVFIFLLFPRICEERVGLLQGDGLR